MLWLLEQKEGWCLQTDGWRFLLLWTFTSSCFVLLVLPFLDPSSDRDYGLAWTCSGKCPIVTSVKTWSPGDNGTSWVGCNLLLFYKLRERNVPSSHMWRIQFYRSLSGASSWSDSAFSLPCRGFSVPADCGAAAHPGDAVCTEVQPAIQRYSQQKQTLNKSDQWS